MVRPSRLHERWFWPVASIAICLLSACGGGGSSTQSAGPRPTASVVATFPPSPPPTPTPAPAPTATGQTYQVHYVILGSGSRGLGAFAGSAPLAPAGATLGPALPGAVITYPDGSSQIADASGSFMPAQSSYGLANAAQLQFNVEAQPQIVISDPAGVAAAGVSTISAYPSSSVAAVRSVQRVASVLRSGKATATINLSGVMTQPSAITLFGGERSSINVEAIDTTGAVTSLQNAIVTWSAQAGQIVAMPGSNQAFYTAPSGASNDVITASVALAGSPAKFNSTTQVSVFAAGSGANISGRVLAPSGAPIAGAVPLFLQIDQSAFVDSVYWTGLSDSQGNYQRQLPANGTFATVLGVPAAASPNNGYGYFVAAIGGGATAFTSGGAGSTSSLNLSIAPPATLFVNALDLVQSATPPIIPFVQDAWNAAQGAVTHRVFDADSGLQSLLANPPAGPFPTPMNPGSVASGQFTGWCYQWSSQNGSAVLQLIANYDSTCSAPGNFGIAITAMPPGNASTSFAYAEYTLPRPYSLASPLNAAPLDATLLESGNWTQLLTTTNGRITSGTISVTIGYYDAGHQTLGAPSYSESVLYQYSLGANGLATTNILNDAIRDAATGLLLTNFNGTQAQTAPLSGPGACVTNAPAAIACYAINGTLTRYFATASGTSTQSFSIAERLNGDGSALQTYQSTSAGNSSKVVIPIASLQAQTAGNCVVCASSLGAVYDLDGTTQLAGFTVAGDLSVSLNLLGSKRGGPPGPVIGTLNFIL